MCSSPRPSDSARHSDGLGELPIFCPECAKREFAPDARTCGEPSFDFGPWLGTVRRRGSKYQGRDGCGPIVCDFGRSRRVWIELEHRSARWLHAPRLRLRRVRRLCGATGDLVTRRGATIYEVRSAGRLISRQEASTAQEAVLQYVRSLGCRDNEIMRVAADTVAWRGAVFSAVSVSE